LGDRSRAPKSHPNAIGADTEDRVIELREKHPSLGAARIRAYLEREEQTDPVPAESTVGAILQRNGLTVSRRRRESRRRGEPLADAGEANALWCIDYQGWFRTGDGTHIDPLTVTDAYSRYLFRCQRLAAADNAHSKPVLEAAFRQYGLL